MSVFNAAVEKFISSLGTSVIAARDLDIKPFIVKIDVNGLKLTLVVYLYNCGESTGGRPADEYKTCLSVPGQKSGLKGNFDFDKGFVLLVGYVKDYDIFVLWDAYKHRDFGYRANIQIKLNTILDAFVNHHSVHERDTKYGLERIICCTGDSLIESICQRWDIYLEDLLKEGPEKRILSRNESIAEVRQEIRKALESNPRISINKLAQKIGMNPDAVKYHVDVLRYNNDLKRDAIPEAIMQRLKQEIGELYLKDSSITLNDVLSQLDITIDFLLHYYTELIENNTCMHESM